MGTRTAGWCAMKRVCLQLWVGIAECTWYLSNFAPATKHRWARNVLDIYFSTVTNTRYRVPLYCSSHLRGDTMPPCNGHYQHCCDHNYVAFLLSRSDDLGHPMSLEVFSWPRKLDTVCTPCSSPAGARNFGYSESTVLVGEFCSSSTCR